MLGFAVPWPAIALVVAIFPTIIWLLCESSGPVWGRRVAAPLMGLGWCGLTAGGIAIASLGADFNRSIEWSGAFCRFALAVDEQLAAGRVDHVRKELDRFHSGAIHETYEGGAFMENLREATAAMESGGE